MAHQTPKNWFWSDLHLGHHAVLRHNSRPWASITEHDAHLIEQWNKHVAPQDQVFIVGDFSFHTPAATSAILRRLNGHKNLIKGNHDSSKDLAKTVGWQKVITYHEAKIDGHKVVLSHFPFLSWNQMHRGAIHLHGHSHGNLRLPPELARARMLDVGVDHLVTLLGEYRPISFEEVLDLMSDRYSASVDHHNA